MDVRATLRPWTRRPGHFGTVDETRPGHFETVDETSEPLWNRGRDVQATLRPWTRCPSHFGTVDETSRPLSGHFFTCGGLWRCSGFLGVLRNFSFLVFVGWWRTCGRSGVSDGARQLGTHTRDGCVTQTHPFLMRLLISGHFFGCCGALIFESLDFSFLQGGGGRAVGGRDVCGAVVSWELTPGTVV